MWIIAVENFKPASGRLDPEVDPLPEVQLSSRDVRSGTVLRRQRNGRERSGVEAAGSAGGQFVWEKAERCSGSQQEGLDACPGHPDHGHDDHQCQDRD
jgi:hypothetical protein